MGECMTTSANIEAYIELLVNAICDRGYIIEANPDLNRWRDCMAAAPGTAAESVAIVQDFWSRLGLTPRFEQEA